MRDFHLQVDCGCERMKRLLYYDFKDSWNFSTDKEKYAQQKKDYSFYCLPRKCILF